MENIGLLLDKAKLIHSLPSDYKLALVMGISQTALIHYRAGKSLPDPRTITKLCALTGDDPEILAAEIEAQRAKTDEAKALWTGIAKRLAAAAAAGIVSASALAGPALSQAGSVCILCKVGRFSRQERLRRRAHRRETVLHRSC